MNKQQLQAEFEKEVKWFADLEVRDGAKMVEADEAFAFFAKRIPLIVEELVGEKEENTTYDSNYEAEKFFDGYLVDNEEEGRSIPYRYLKAAMVDSKNLARQEIINNASEWGSK